MKPTAGMEVAAALIAVAAANGAKDVDAYLSLYFKTLEKILQHNAEQQKDKKRKPMVIA